MVKINCLVIVCFIFILPLFAFEIEEMEFIDQPIKDILFTLARITGNSIITDSTVSGKGSYYFIDTDLEAALKQFLSVYDLSFSKSDGVYYVSRVIVEFEKESSKLTLYGKDVKPGLLIEKIGKVIGKTILYDELPEELISVNVIGMGVAEVLKMIMYRFEEYEIESYPNYFYIKKTGLLNKTTLIENSGMIKMENNLYSISAPSIRLSDALKQLFKESGNEFSLMKRGDTVLESLFFKNKTFDEMLRLLLERSDGDYTVRESVYYIFDISRNEIMKKFDYLEYIKLESIPVELLPALFPAGLAGSSVFKIDRENNAIILSGSSEETAPVRDFIHKMEEEYGNKVISELDLSFLTADELLKLLPLRMKNLEIRRTGDPGKIIIEASRELTDDFISYVKLLDSSSESEVVSLKYIRSDKLLKNLPPSVSEENILKSNDPNTIFFKGSDERLERFLSDLEHIDIPVPQIRYELLVIQYQESRNKEFSLNFGNEILNEGAQTTILGSLGKVINLNLDIVSTFGYQFAVDLNAKLGESDARIMVDTSLNGLSGEIVSFKNTNTYRYRDMEVDPDTGKAESTGVTREITSGLIINLNGWVSGDQMITMEVKATVSKRGADVSSGTGNPPPTSEKIISTHIRTASGKPVVIGGLLQKDRDLVIEKVPFLGDIPGLGLLFRNEVSTITNTEMVIYIVPYIEYPVKEPLSESKIIEEYYMRFFGNKVTWR